MNASAEDKGNGDIHPWLIAPVVALAAFMEILDISVANVALPHIAGDLSVSQDESTWALTSYLVTNAAVMPVSGWLSGRLGRKRFFLICIISFTIASLACGLAPSLGALVLLRAVQGAAGGGLQPTGQAILTDSFPVEQRGVATSIYGVAAVVAPAIGPTLGGFITDNYEWRWVFLMNVPIGIILALLLAFVVRTPHEEPERGKGAGSVDWAGFGLVALALGCLQIVMDRGQEDDWFADPMITALTIISAISFVLLIWRELTAENPMIDLRLFKRRNFAIGFVLMFAFGFMILGTTYLLPAFAQALMGYRATEAGEVLFPGGVLLIVMFLLVGRVMNKVDLRLLIALGLILCAGAIWWQTNFYLEIPFWVLALGRVMQAVGLGFLFIPINTLGFRDIPPDRTNYGSALINLARNFGGSVGISFASTLVTRREQFHQNHLVGYLQALHPGFTGFSEKLGQLTHSTPVETTARIYQTMLDQATLLSYLDAFKALAVSLLLLLPLLLFVSKGTGAGGAAPG